MKAKLFYLTLFMFLGSFTVNNSIIECLVNQSKCILKVEILSISQPNIGMTNFHIERIVTVKKIKSYLNDSLINIDTIYVILKSSPELNNKQLSITEGQTYFIFLDGTFNSLSHPKKINSLYSGKLSNTYNNVIGYNLADEYVGFLSFDLLKESEIIQKVKK